MSKFKLFSLNT